jgi:CDP-paratose synthetase
MNVLLTGATGFLGSRLTRAFLGEGHSVIALKRGASDLRRLADVRDDVTFFDLDRIDLVTPFKEQGPIDAVVHTSTCYGRAGETATQVFEANTLFPLRLLEIAHFFNTNTFFNTDTILYPYLNAYALSKKQFVDWGRLFSAARKIRFVNIRLDHMYGPGDDPSKFTAWIIEQCLANVPEIKLTEGQQRRDFIYIDDVVAGYGTLLQHATALGNGFQEIGLDSGHSGTVRGFVESVHRLTESSSLLNFGALPSREHEFMESQADTQRLHALGWRSSTDLEAGIKKTIEESKL